MEFTKVFIVGLIILLGIYVFMGGFKFAQEEGGYRFIPPSRNQTIGEEEAEGQFIGTKAAEDSKRFFLNSEPFTVSRVSKNESFITLSNFWVKNGLFETKEYKKTFNLTQEELKQLAEPKIDLHVENTNLYGSLMVFLNDEEVFSGYIEPGDKKQIPVNKTLFKKENYFSLIPASSSWRIWAPTVYILDLELSSSFYGKSSKSFTVNIPEKNCPVLYSKIILDIPEREGSGSLIVRANKQVVFNNTPTSRQWIEFEGKINCGNNTISMVSTQNAKFKINEAHFLVFWKRESSETLEYTLDISQAQHNRLPGEIKFKIEKVFGSPTSLVAKVKDTQGTTHSLVVQGILQKGNTITMNLPRDYVDPGKNKVIFSVTGAGGFTITDLRIDY